MADPSGSGGGAVDDTGREYVIVERIDCESITVMKRRVLRMVHIFVASSRESSTEMFSDEPHVTRTVVRYTPMSFSTSMPARALCAQSFSTFLASFWRHMTTASNVFQPSEGDDSASSGRILALNLEKEGMAGKSEEPVTALSALGNGADWLHGPGLSYGNEGCFSPVGLVNESCPLGVVLQDTGREARKVPEEKVASMVVIKYDERAYNGKVRSINYTHKGHLQIVGGP